MHFDKPDLVREVSYLLWFENLGQLLFLYANVLDKENYTSLIDLYAVA